MDAVFVKELYGKSGRLSPPLLVSRESSRVLYIESKIPSIEIQMKYLPASNKDEKLGRSVIQAKK